MNGVIQVETGRDSHELIACLKGLERDLGRCKTFRWGPRIIDLDILLFDQEQISSRNLQIPHPHLQERAFVLVPLCEIDPEAVHPGLRKTARRLLEELGEIEGIEKI